MKKIFLFCICLAVGSLALQAEVIQYRVVRGDTLYSLSKRFNISVDEILDANSMSSDSLRVDMVLNIPGQSSSESYIIQKGDTLYSISRRFHVELNQLMELNGLNSSAVLKEGDILLLHSSGSTGPVVVIEQTENEENSEKDGNEESSVTIIDVSHTTGVTVAPPLWPVRGDKQSYSGNIEGVVIRSEPGEQVQSVTAGRVMWTGSYREFGQVVLVDDGEHILFYGGSRDIFVNVGEVVSAGSVIGRLGFQESNGGVPMFFAVFQSGRAVDIDQIPRG